MSNPTAVLRVPATSGYVHLARTATTALLARRDFTVDELNDSMLAIDEASTLMIGAAAPEAILEFKFTLGEDELAVELLVATRDGQPPRSGSWGWIILKELADNLETGLTEDGSARLGLVLRRMVEA